MGRFSSSSLDEEAETGIDMSPLIDCVFILLIFFIVTTVFVEESGIPADKPQAASASQQESTSVVFEVDANGRVFHDDREIGIAGVLPTVKRETARGGDVPIVIQGAKDSRHGAVYRVLDQIHLAAPGVKVSLASK